MAVEAKLFIIDRSIVAAMAFVGAWFGGLFLALWFMGIHYRALQARVGMLRSFRFRRFYFSARCVLSLLINFMLYPVALAVTAAVCCARTGLVAIVREPKAVLVLTMQNGLLLKYFALQRWLVCLLNEGVGQVADLNRCLRSVKTKDWFETDILMGFSPKQ